MIACFCGDECVIDADVLFLEEKIRNVTEYLLRDGRVVFISDGYSDYGLLCKRIIEEYKKDYPHIICLSAMEYIAPGYEKGNYDVMLRGSIEPQNRNTAKQKCNDYLIAKADIIICYYKHSKCDMPLKIQDRDLITISL